MASALLAFSLLITVPASRPPDYVAVLQNESTGASWIVEVDKEAVRLRPLATVSVPPGKALQFWTKPEGAAGPTSLGLLGTDQGAIVPLSKLPGISTNQLFEVTLEPESGSSLDRPTGAILALGKAVPL
jgi:anti-sigma-K factor RskA